MNFITFDFETGMQSRNSAISMGLVKYSKGKKIGTYYSLIKPPKLYIRPEFTDIHGITVNDVKNAPTFGEIWPAIRSFIGDYPLAAHNANFDTSVLIATLESNNIGKPRGLRYFDTLPLARRIWPNFSCHKLTYLGEQFNISYDAHNALVDSETLGEVIIQAAKKLRINPSTGNIENLLEKADMELIKL